MQTRFKLGLMLTTVVMTAGVYFMKLPPKNVRNNNPLNLKNSADWVGESTTKKDKTFEVFSSPEYGFRAAYRTLMTYRNSYGLKTVSDIIKRWAPAPVKAGDDHNETQAYIDYVLKRIEGLSFFGLYEPELTLEQYPELMLAMSDFEGAKGHFTLAQAHAGVALA
jgi:hypothetical protein